MPSGEGLASRLICSRSRAKRRASRAAAAGRGGAVLAFRMATAADAGSGEAPIKTMKLYSHVDRVYNELREAGASVEGSGAAVKISGVTKDMLLNLPGLYLNYGQCESVELALERLGLAGDDGDGKVVVDVGAGVGQPARTMAWASPGLRILAVDLQPDQVAVGNKLTEAAGLEVDRCTLKAADFLDGDLVAPKASVDGVVSWLCVLHMGAEGRKVMWNRSAALLKPGAKIFVEDFFRRSDFTDKELEVLSKDVYCEGNELATREEYIAELEAAGFEDVQFEDMTEVWAKFCKDRCAAYKAAQERMERVHNAATFQDLCFFYEAVVGLFDGPNLGGVRVTATRSA